MASQDMTTRAVSAEESREFEATTHRATATSPLARAVASPTKADVSDLEARAVPCPSGECLPLSPMASIEQIRASGADSAMAHPLPQYATPLDGASSYQAGTPLSSVASSAAIVGVALQATPAAASKVQFAPHPPPGAPCKQVGAPGRKTGPWLGCALIGWSIFWIVLVIAGIIALFFVPSLSLWQKFGAAVAMLVLLALILYAINLRKPYPDRPSPPSGACPTHEVGAGKAGCGSGSGSGKKCPEHENNKPPAHCATH